MTERRKFIRQAFVAFRPKREQFTDALGWARDAWDFLSANGEGEARSREPRESGVDWYGKLSHRQREQFDVFWKAYGYKKGKAGAAMRFGQLGDLPGEVFLRIVAAARAEARQWKDGAFPAGQTRIYAQGWLEARRWEDYEPPAQAALTPGPSADRRELLSKLAGLRQLNSAKPNPALQQQIDALEAQLGDGQP
ncbi:MAG: hypothetical protein EPN21_07960 [Methylococcaceae bacterium]|nr:MAG: hypothetical protein EPN21_07960 [Methylococcaceae bacterium]